MEPFGLRPSWPQACPPAKGLPVTPGRPACRSPLQPVRPPFLQCGLTDHPISIPVKRLVDFEIWVLSRPAGSFPGTETAPRGSPGDYGGPRGGFGDKGGSTRGGQPALSPPPRAAPIPQPAPGACAWPCAACLSLPHPLARPRCPRLAPCSLSLTAGAQVPPLGPRFRPWVGNSSLSEPSASAPGPVQAISHCQGPGSIPGWRTEVPQAMLHSRKKKLVEKHFSHDQ